MDEFTLYRMLRNNYGSVGVSLKCAAVKNEDIWPKIPILHFLELLWNWYFSLSKVKLWHLILIVRSLHTITVIPRGTTCASKWFSHVQYTHCFSIKESPHPTQSHVASFFMLRDLLIDFPLKRFFLWKKWDYRWNRAVESLSVTERAFEVANKCQQPTTGLACSPFKVDPSTFENRPRLV